MIITVRPKTLDFIGIFFFLLFTLSGNVRLISQVSDLSEAKFDYLTSDNGLSHNTVTTTLKDKDGVLWIGTFDGLNRYDGRTIKVFHHDPGDTTSLSNNTIWDIIEARDGDLWCITYDGLNRLDRRTNTFTRYLIGEQQYKMSDLTEDALGNIWIATNGDGLIKLTWPKNEEKRRDNATIKIFSSLKHKIIPDIISVFLFNRDNPDLLWLGTNEGLFQFDTKNEDLIPVHLELGTEDDVGVIPIVAIFQDRDGDLWLGTPNNGLINYSLRTGEAVQFIHDTKNSQSIGGNNVTGIAQDLDGKIWSAIFDNGISIYDKDLGHFENIQASSSALFGLSANTFNEIYCDHSGFVWMATSGGGLVYYNPNISYFKHLHSRLGDGQSLISDNISSVYVDSWKDVWVGTHGYGINHLTFDSTCNKLNEVRFFQEDGDYSLRSNRVLTLHQNSSDQMLAGFMAGGFAVLPKGEKQFQDYLQEPGDLDDIMGLSIYCFYEKGDQLWIGGKGGLYVYDYLSSHLSHVPGIDNILQSKLSDGCNAIVEDDDGWFWLGSATDGLLKYDPVTEEVIIFEDVIDGDLRSEINLTLMKDSEGYLWAGFWGGGAMRINPKTDDYKYYSRTEGLPNDEVYSIVEAEDHTFWISTNKGISHLDIKNERFQNYTKRNGLQGEEFNSRVGGKDPITGTIFFGGVNGLNMFDPSRIINDSISTPLFFSDLTKIRTEGQEAVRYTDGKIKEKESVVLSYKDHTVVLGISLVDYVAAKDVTLRYQLKGASDAWINLNQESEIRIINLNAGSYRLNVQASKNGRLIKNGAISLGIVMRPPWWKTKLAYLIYLLFGLFAFYAFYRYRMLQVKKYTELRTNISSDLHDDVGSLLTGVAMQSEMMSHFMDDDKKKGMDEISSLSRDAMDRMRDIVWAIDSRKDKYENLIDRMRSFAELQLPTKNIRHRFDIKNIDGRSSINPERRQNLYLIFKEAITNILKHSDGDFVLVTFQRFGNKYQLMISDNGTQRKIIPSDGLGMSNIKMRVERLKGSLVIRQIDGFSIEITI